MANSELNEIFAKYSKGEYTAEQANKKLEEIGSSLRLQPGKNELTAAEIKETKVGKTPADANGYGLLDTGTGFMDKVKVVNGKLTGADMGESYALVVIGGKIYHVKGATLVG